MLSLVSRLSLPIALAAVFLLASSAATANSIAFGSSVFVGSTTNENNGASGDKNSTQSHSAGGTTANFRAQASADSLTSDARIDVTYTWDVPYTITRTVTVDETSPSDFELTVPTQLVEFDFEFDGRIATDGTGVVGGGFEGAQIFNGISVTSLGGLSINFNATGAQGNGDTVNTAVVRTGSDNYAPGLNQSGAAVGEVSLIGQIPVDYRVWEDLVDPLATDYEVNNSFVQSFTDTLRVSFRVRAVSRPSGSVSTSAGEAIACAGLTSQLGSFGLDNGLNCGSGLTIDASISQTGSTVLPNIPEPGTLILLGVSLGGLALVGRRVRRQS
ncbi:MAG: PEP-CTERM sorting domain-containing protein [Myxococcota bacterium]